MFGLAKPNKMLKLDSLERRREKLCLQFAKKCTTHEKLNNIFPLNKTNHKMTLRNQKKYKSKRYKQSAPPYMRKLLNDEYTKKNMFLKKVKS